MQVRPTPSKPKYKIKEYALLGNHSTNKVSFSKDKQNLQHNCICQEFLQSQTRRCSRCRVKYHKCVTKVSIKTEDDWECLHCQGFYMDPIFSVNDILVETFFKTDSVYQYANEIEFHFYLSQSQFNNPVEVRSLQDERGGVLAWPMQGQFYINKDHFSDPVIDFKPLLFNSNRKHRKEECLILPANKLKQGKNVLTFSIPKLNKTTFGNKFQCEERNIYYFGVYSIKKLTKEMLISKTSKNNRINKQESLKLLKRLVDHGDTELSVEKIKLNLQCPYTKNRIKVPVRGNKCTHYTCLCLDTLIQTRLGMSSRQWSCPICNHKINEPVIDTFILSILNDGYAGTQVMLSINGKYEWISKKNNQISLDDSDQSIEMPRELTKKKQQQNEVQRPATQIITQPNNQKVGSEKHFEMIDIEDSPIIQPASNKLPELNIIIPEDIPETKRKQSLENRDKPKKYTKQREKQKHKEKQKERKMRKTNNSLYNYLVPQKQLGEFMITDIKQLQFRALTQDSFTKKYFIIEQPRQKVQDDLRNIFKQVL